MFPARPGIWHLLRLYASMLLAPLSLSRQLRAQLAVCREKRDETWDLLQAANVRIRELERECIRLRAANLMKPRTVAVEN